MNQINKFQATITKFVFVSIVILTASCLPVAHAFAQDDGSYDGSYDTGSSYDGSYDTGSSYDGSYDTGATGYDGSYDTGATGYDGSYDTGSSYDGSYDTGSGDTYGTGYGDGTYGSGYADGTYGDGTADGTYGDGTADGTYSSGYADDTYGSGYADSDTPDYSYTAPEDYSSSGSCGCSSTPTFSVTNPIYSTPGVGYSSHIYTTPGTGFASTPIYTPTPVTHTTTPAPIVYNTPVQTQTQTQTAATSQPIIINNTNTNTNTLTNTNTAPVAQVVSTPPQQIVDYVYPRTTPIYQAPVANAPYVSLTQIPYTGFDFGPVGDAIYWAALLAFALAAAYLLVYYRGGAFALAGALISHRSSVTPVQFTEAEAESTPAVEAPIVEAPVAVNARLASIASPIQNLPTAEVRRMTSDAMIVSHSHNGSAPRIVITRA